MGAVLQSNVYSIQAVKIGQSPSWNVSMISPVLRSDVGKEMPLPFPIWVIKSKDETILVDTGIDTSVTDPMPIGKSVYGVVESLAEAGVEASKITKVIVTHMHIDHFTGYTKFPNAIFYIQRTELDHYLGPNNQNKYLTGGLPMRAVQDTIALLRHGRVKVLEGDEELFPGVKVMLAGGHSPGLQMISVETEKGTAVLASDNAYLYHNIRENVPVGWYYHLGQSVEALELCRKTASSPDLIIPGHDYALWGDKRMVDVV